jgi:transposase
MDAARADFDWRAWRRSRALELKRQGWVQADIAAALDVTPAAVSQWLALARRHGPDALGAHPAPGPPARLTPDQRALIPEFLWHGAEAYGFRGDVWTRARVAAVIAEEFGVRYHKGHVGRLLQDLGWTPQVPVTRAAQRDEAAIDRWRLVTWPELRVRAGRGRRTPVFVDEAGFYLLPGAVRTYAPAGLTPVVYEWQTRDHLSVIGAVTPAGKVFTLVRTEALTGLEVIEFLAHLRRVAGARLLVIWDGSPIHRRAAVTEFVAATGGAVQVERLPAYAPDLNPVEGLWQHLKHVELRNQPSVDLEELHLELHLAIGRVRQKSRLIPAFFTGAGLDC